MLRDLRETTTYKTINEHNDTKDNLFNKQPYQLNQSTYQPNLNNKYDGDFSNINNMNNNPIALNNNGPFNQTDKNFNQHQPQLSFRDMGHQDPYTNLNSNQYNKYQSSMNNTVSKQQPRLSPSNTNRILQNVGQSIVQNNANNQLYFPQISQISPKNSHKNQINNPNMDMPIVDRIDDILNNAGGQKNGTYFSDMNVANGQNGKFSFM